MKVYVIPRTYRGTTQAVKLERGNELKRLKRLTRLGIYMENLERFGKVRLADDKVLVMGKDCTRLIMDKDYSFEGVVLEIMDNEKDLIRVLNDNLD